MAAVVRMNTKHKVADYDSHEPRRNEGTHFGAVPLSCRDHGAVTLSAFYPSIVLRDILVSFS